MNLLQFSSMQRFEIVATDLYVVDCAGDNVCFITKFETILIFFIKIHAVV